MTYNPNTLGYPYNAKNFGGAGDVVTDDTAAVSACFTVAAANSSSVLLPDGTYLITSNTTTTAPVTFSPSAKLSVRTGVTFTINGAISAPLTQIFSGVGTVVTNGTGDYPIQWWGGKGDNSTDNTAAMNAAHASGRVIYYPQGNYIFTTLNPFALGGIKGDGDNLTFLVSTDTSGAVSSIM